MDFKLPPLGDHRIIEFWDCDPVALDDLDRIKSMFDTALKISHATVINVVMHKFSPQGVTGVAAIAESHVSIHTWPELGYAAIDVFTCGTKMNTDILLSHFETVLKPGEKSEIRIARGQRLRVAKSI
ncbi:MAG: adenosylmethionine decarboxylase [Proteobacteria bacterium]|nr:MAG: adenosylmethionine decarboxylase [Pseudomonadota bacterium]